MPLLRQFGAVPNILTLARLFFIPFIVISVLDGRWRIGFTLMMIAGISDAFDGLLARWLKQQTMLGQYLDPIADKLLLSTLFLLLTHMNEIPRYVAVLVFSRDLGVTLISTVLFATNTLRDFRPAFLGKLNTFLQIVAVACVMGSNVFTIPYIGQFDSVLLRIIAVLCPVSAAQYAWIVIRKISRPIEPLPPAAA
jgi:cardiolipin synthase (CMP-forming)